MYPKGPKQEPAAFASQPMIEAAQVEFRRGLGRGGWGVGARNVRLKRS